MFMILIFFTYPLIFIFILVFYFFLPVYCLPSYSFLSSFLCLIHRIPSFHLHLVSVLCPIVSFPLLSFSCLLLPFLCCKKDILNSFPCLHNSSISILAPPFDILFFPSFPFLHLHLSFFTYPIYFLSLSFFYPRQSIQIALDYLF